MWEYAAKKKIKNTSAAVSVCSKKMLLDQYKLALFSFNVVVINLNKKLPEHYFDEK